MARWLVHAIRQVKRTHPGIFKKDKRWGEKAQGNFQHMLSMVLSNQHNKVFTGHPAIILSASFPAPACDGISLSKISASRICCTAPFDKSGDALPH
jgi:hypothetical protein